MAFTNGGGTPSQTVQVGGSAGASSHPLAMSPYASTPSGVVQSVNTGIMQANVFQPYSVSTAVATRLVASSGSTAVNVLRWTASVSRAATGNTTITLEYGTSVTTPCDTGATVLDAYTWAAGDGADISGIGPQYVVPAMACVS